MTNLFASAHQALDAVSEKLRRLMLQVAASGPGILNEAQWTAYGDHLTSLYHNIQQFDSLVNLGFNFTDTLPQDIPDFFNYLNEHYAALEEVVGYRLYRSTLSDSSFAYPQDALLEEALQGIRTQANALDALLEAVG
jgi:hypothetical protein